MIKVNLSDGRSLNIDTDDKDVALGSARKFLANNPFVERGAQLGEEDVSAFGDIARGVGAGLVGAVEGIASLPAELVDLISDDDESNAQTVRDFFSQYKPTTSTTLGEAAKFITQFAVPGGLAAKAAKAARLGRAGEVAAFAAADVAATTPDVETLGDFFDGGPTKRINTEGLMGAERAAAELGNRFKVAGEGAALILGVPKALGLASKGIGAGADALAKTERLKNTARAIRDPDSILSNVGVKPDIEDPTFLQKNIAKASKLATRYLTFQGDMPDSLSKQLESLRVQELNSSNNAARQSLEEVDNTLKALKASGNLNDVDERVTLNALNDYLFAEKKGNKSREIVRNEARLTLSGIDETLNKAKTPSLLLGKRDFDLVKTADKLRKQIDDMSDKILEDTFMSAEMSAKLTTAIGANKTYYATRMYRSLKDENGYVPTPDQTDKALKEILNISEAANIGQAMSEEAAYGVLNDLRRKVSFNNANMKPQDQFAESTLSGVGQKIMKGRTLDNLPAVRDFLGEYSGGSNVFGRVKRSDGTFGEDVIRQRSLEEQRVGLRTRAIETVDGMTKAITKANYYKNLNDYNNSLPLDNRFIFDAPPANLPIEEIGKYKRIGMEDAFSGAEVSQSAKNRFGPLAGKYVKEEYHRAFEDIPAGILSGDTNKLWATFLALKGASQVSKTVLSPITQVRNATTAAFFALRNGNFGNNENLLGSAETVFSQIGQRIIKLDDVGFGVGSKNARSTKTEIDDYYNEMIDLGIVNTNSKVGEFEDLFKDALNAKGGVYGKKAIQAAQNIQNTFAGKLYQGSDDVWKIYSYEMELGRLKDAFKNSPLDLPVTDVQNALMLNGRKPSELVGDEVEAFLKREAAGIVKDTVPNYARVPEFIKQLRRLPFGNFVAFPAEIIRTSGNTYGRAIKELGSESTAIRSIGMRRLMGSMTVDAGMYGGLMAGGLALTGATMEQVNAFKRSGAATYEKNAMLIPIATDKDGKITDFYNFSYTNPYDYLTRGARGVFNAVNDGITGEKELTEIFMDGATQGLGEYFSPFLGESIITEKLLDITRNETRFGRSVYLDSDPTGVKLGKSFAHLADGLSPGFLPADLTASATSSMPLGLSARLKDFPTAIGVSAGLLDSSDAVKRSGIRIDPAGEFMEALTGIKTVKPALSDALRYKGYEAGRQVTSAGGIFNQLAKTRGRANAEDLTKAYLVSNEQRFKALRDLNMAIEDARTLGMSDAEIARSLKEAKVPQINYLLAGRFNTFFPSTETINKAFTANENKLSNPFDFEAMNEVRQKLQGKFFRPQAQADAQAAQQLAAQPPAQAQPAAPMPPAQAGTQPRPPQPGAPVPPAPPQSLFDRGVDALKQVELNKLLGID